MIPQFTETIKILEIGEKLCSLLLSYTPWLVCFSALKMDITCGYQIHKQIIFTIDKDAPL